MAIAKLKELHNDATERDKGYDHVAADNILCDLLGYLGCVDVVKEYNKLTSGLIRKESTEMNGECQHIVMDPKELARIKALPIMSANYIDEKNDKGYHIRDVGDAYIVDCSWTLSTKTDSLLWSIRALKEKPEEKEVPE